MTELAGQRCEACSPGTPTLSEDEIGGLRGELSAEWTIRDGSRLVRTLRFPNFVDTFAAATKVALLAEAEGHHPDMTVRWGRLGIELTTHAAGGLTRNDFIFAAKVDRL